MPKLRKDVEDKILELIDQGYTNIEVSEQTGVHRKTVANRRKAPLKRKQDEEKPEIEKENISDEEIDLTAFGQKLNTLM
ncbi:unnamed protein product, partial [marine sediment metagenome]